ncbi:MAG: sterol desaturase family protein [Gammaproteobacteria bacterium]
MDIDLDTGKLYVFLGGLVLFAGLEQLFPARPWCDARWRRWLFHAGVAALNTVIVRQLVFVPFLLWLVYTEEEGWGITRWLGIVGWTEILLSIVMLDFFDYLWHRANHRLRPLWRMHKAHHADPEMDVTTALRFHPGELVYSGLVKAGWVLLWGPTMVAWFLFEALVSLCAQFHHSNFDFPDRVERILAWFIVTPRYHAAHHAVDRRFGDANFATILSVWDRLFGTYAAPAAGGATTRGVAALGLPEDRALAFSWRAWLDEPFRSRNLALPAARRVRSGAGSQ